MDLSFVIKGSCQAGALSEPRLSGPQVHFPNYRQMTVPSTQIGHGRVDGVAGPHRLLAVSSGSWQNLVALGRILGTLLGFRV